MSHTSSCVSRHEVTLPPVRAVNISHSEPKREGGGSCQREGRNPANGCGVGICGSPSGSSLTRPDPSLLPQFVSALHVAGFIEPAVLKRRDVVDDVAGHARAGRARKRRILRRPRARRRRILPRPSARAPRDGRGRGKAVLARSMISMRRIISGCNDVATMLLTGEFLKAPEEHRPRASVGRGAKVQARLRDLRTITAAIPMPASAMENGSGVEAAPSTYMGPGPTPATKLVPPFARLRLSNC
jgi:hypothetical protein